jgi:hypothetical protein
MKVYEVECRAVITVTAEDMQKAALYGAAVIKDNTDLICVRAVHESNFTPAAGAPRHDFLVGMRASGVVRPRNVVSPLG